MRSLSGVDGAFLHLETPETPMHVASLHVFDLPSGYRGDFHARIKRQMRARLKLAPVFTRKLAPMPLQLADPVWVADDKVDLDCHVQRVTLPSPGTQAQLEDCAAALHAELLDRSRPLWRLVVIDGLQTGQAAYYVQVHHAVLDGQAGVLLARALFDVAPRGRTTRGAPRAAESAEHPGLLALAGAALKHDAAQYIKLVRHLPEVVKSLAGLWGGKAPKASTVRTGVGQNFAFGPKTLLNVPITAPRSFAAASIPLATIKAVAAANEAKVNDVVLALCSGTLRRYLARHGGVPRKPLIATMPISLRQAGNTEYTTQATLSLVNLHTNIAGPIKRLHAIRDAASAMKSLAARASNVIPTDFPSIGVPWLLQGLAALYGRVCGAGVMPTLANVVISNVQGPPQPLYAAGARMAGYWPMSIIEHGVGLNITVMSYDGQVGFGFTAARNAVPDARELSAALMDALAELTRSPKGAATCVPAKPASRRAVRPSNRAR